MTDPIRSGRSGQSFVGLLTVLLVLAVLTALAAPHIDFTRYRSDAIARQAVGVITSARRMARRGPHPMLVHLDSAGKRLGIVDDANGNGRADSAERVWWTEFDAASDLLDPPAPLPERRGSRGPAGGTTVGFGRRGETAGALVIYLTSDPGTPAAWRAVRVTAPRGDLELWRFEGAHWMKGRP